MSWVDYDRVQPNPHKLSLVTQTDYNSVQPNFKSTYINPQNANKQMATSNSNLKPNGILINKLH